MQPELFLADALGAAGKPMLRVHTAGSVGGSTFIVGSHLIESGIHDRVLAVSWEKQSEGNAQWGLAGGRSRGIGAGGAFAPWIRAYIETDGRARVHRVAGRGEGPAERAQEPVRAPEAARHHDRDRSRSRSMLWDPLRFLESCPSSDGACAVVLTNEANAKRASKPAAWVAATAVRSELGQFSPDATRSARRRASSARTTSIARPGIGVPAPGDRRRRVVRAVQLVRADVARGPRHRRAGRGLEDGRERRHRDHRLVSRSTRRAACSRRTRSARRACCASPRPRCRCAGSRASTRSTAYAPRWPRPTAAAPSTSPWASCAPNLPNPCRTCVGVPAHGRYSDAGCEAVSGRGPC